MLRKLFKKSLVYFATLVSGKLLTAAFFIILARILQPEKFGLITYFMTVVQVVNVFSDFGLKSWYQKQMAKKNQSDLLLGLLQWRLILCGISIAGLTILQLLLRTIPLSMLLPMMTLLILEALVSVGDGYYLARQNSLALGYKLIARNLLLFGSLFWIRSPQDYQVFFWASNIALLVVLIGYLPWQEIYRKITQTQEQLPKIQTALPYAVIDSLGVIYSRADSLLIENLRGATALGIYGAAYRYLDAFNLLPQALFHNLFPIAAKKNGITISQLKKMVVVMFGLGIIVAAGLFISSDFLTTTLMGESYQKSGVILQALSLVVVLFFFNAPLNTVIQSSNQVKKYLPILASMVVVNIVLNLILIPVVGIMGAVIAMIATEAGLVICNLWLANKIYTEIQLSA